MKKKVLQRIAVMMTALAAVCLLFAPVDSKAEKTGKASMTWKVVEQDDETGNTLIDEPKIASNYTGLIETENGIFWAVNGTISKSKTDIVKDTIGVTPDGRKSSKRNECSLRLGKNGKLQNRGQDINPEKPDISIPLKRRSDRFQRCS